MLHFQSSFLTNSHSLRNYSGCPESTYQKRITSIYGTFIVFLSSQQEKINHDPGTSPCKLFQQITTRVYFVHLLQWQSRNKLQRKSRLFFVQKPIQNKCICLERARMTISREIPFNSERMNSMCMYACMVCFLLWTYINLLTWVLSWNLTILIHCPHTTKTSP